MAGDRRPRPVARPDRSRTRAAATVRDADALPVAGPRRRGFEDAPVLFAYLFGSQATGRGRPGSDVDVAVYLDGSVAAERYLDLSLRFAGDLERVCGVGPVEALLVLNEARIELAGRVLAARQVIYSRDEPACVAYESRTFRQYHDCEQHAGRCVASGCRRSPEATPDGVQILRSRPQDLAEYRRVVAGLADTGDDRSAELPATLRRRLPACSRRACPGHTRRR